MDTGIAEILEKKADRVAKAAERRKERSDKGEENKLLIERNEYGFYTVRYKEGGQVPEHMRAPYTRRQRLIDDIVAYYGDTRLVLE